MHVVKTTVKLGAGAATGTLMVLLMNDMMYH